MLRRWLAALGASIGGVWYAWNPPHLLGSMVWGAMPGLVIFLASLLPWPAHLPRTRPASSHVGRVAALLGLFLLAFVAGVALVFFYHLVQFLWTPFGPSPGGSWGVG